MIMNQPNTFTQEQRSTAPDQILATFHFAP